MYYVVSYDIENDKTRTKVARVLLNYGERVQYSVFDCDITVKQLSQLKNKLEKLIDPKKDSIRIYALCQACFKNIGIIGQGKIVQDEDSYIV